MFINDTENRHSCCLQILLLITSTSSINHDKRRTDENAISLSSDFNETLSPPPGQLKYYCLVLTDEPLKSLILKAANVWVLIGRLIIHFCFILWLMCRQSMMEVCSSDISVQNYLHPTITLLDWVLNYLYIPALHAREAIKWENLVFIDFFKLGKTNCELNTKNNS